MSQVKNLILIVFLFVSTSLLAQKADDILGNWITNDGERKISIYKQEDKYFGKIHWAKDENQKSEVGKVVMMNMAFKDGKYEDGTFLMPSGKHSASCALKIIKSNVIQITIYHGLQLFGHSIYLLKTI